MSSTGSHRQVTARSVLLSLGQIVCLGGTGGAINAWLCYMQWPVPAADNVDFPLHVIPAGAGHGALLALVAVGAAMLLCQHRLWLRFAALAVVGWLSGFLSWMPLNASLNLEWPEEFPWDQFFEPGISLLTWPFLYFGFVGLACYFALGVCRGLRLRKPEHHVALGSVSGTLGSLYWWIAWTPWYFSLIHGSIWGGLVGYGIWRALRREGARPEAEPRPIR